ncbi:Germin-like protein subfamily 1 member 20 [Morella rubra]|uniref:Germin-like protein subfamily 1 member 20 n=1 Tax=Morella rubra TaxID=262757 RepID=A0A6A1V393_9ROSI|nr:Germin-like protein subfamily 1 member 20 [Morella rubra]
MMRSVPNYLVPVALLALACTLVSTYGPSLLQDFCVAINSSTSFGLNTLDISLARIDFAPYGLNPPHTHPRGIEIIVVAEGTLYGGFVTSNTDTSSAQSSNKEKQLGTHVSVAFPRPTLPPLFAPFQVRSAPAIGDFWHHQLAAVEKRPPPNNAGSLQLLQPSPCIPCYHRYLGTC